MAVFGSLRVETSGSTLALRSTIGAVPMVEGPLKVVRSERRRLILHPR